MKAKLKSDEEINAEIEALKTMKPNVLRRSGFGDNHHDAIDAQITVLSERWDEDDVYDAHEAASEDEPFRAENEKEGALEAVRWMRGEEEKTPSSEWQCLVIPSGKGGAL